MNNFSNADPADVSVCQLDHLGILVFDGPDSANFLHGQLSNDIENLQSHSVILAAYCNPKGRVITIMRILKITPQRFLILMPKDLIETVAKRLRMFVLRAKVQVEILDQAVILGLTDATLASRINPNLPGDNQLLELSDSAWLIAVRPGETPVRYLYIAMDQNTADKHTTGIDCDGDSEHWLSIQAADGVPEVFHSTSEAFLPQGINLDLIDGVNFRKGCYPGQEIVARLRYLGKLKQRMLRVRYNGSSHTAGENIYSSGKKIGQLVFGSPIDSRESDTRGNAGLVSVNFANLDRDAVTFEDETAIEVFNLPYEVPELTEST
ncbi:MAG: folate-binding protein [marine bacterium B5-7]|nr:MAG: folate-binding protein [marine bacterium B5-7]